MNEPQPKRKAFSFLYSYYDAVKMFPADIRCKAYENIFNYVFHGIEPNFEAKKGDVINGVLYQSFATARPLLDGNIQRYENGKQPKRKKPKPPRPDPGAAAAADGPVLPDPERSQESEPEDAGRKSSDTDPGAAAAADGPALPDPEQRQKKNTAELITGEVIDTKATGKTALEKEFSETWALYPKKQGKAAALKSYIKARKAGTEQAEIMDGIRRYVEYIRRENIKPQFVKQGSTWYNGQCWTDDYSAGRPVDTGDIAKEISFLSAEFM